MLNRTLTPVVRHRLVLVVAMLPAAILADRSADAQTVWDGPTVVFTKADFADYTLPENQDQLTAGVALTRNDFAGLYNIAAEPFYGMGSPAGTEWAYGHAADYASLTFTNWFTWHGGNPPSAIGQDAVVHLIDEDIYLDIKLTSWTCCAGGGGFSWERSSPGGDGCFTVTSEVVECHPDGSGFTYSVLGTDSCSGGESEHVFSATGGAPGQQFCFSFIVFDDAGAICCTTQQCVTIPDCAPEPAGTCDLDGDNVMGTSDFLLLLGAWGSQTTPAADLDGDGVVGTMDFLMLLAAWGPCG